MAETRGLLLSSSSANTSVKTRENYHLQGVEMFYKLLTLMTHQVFRSSVPEGSTEPHYENSKQFRLDTLLREIKG